MRMKLHVYIDAPRGASREEIAQYAFEAIASHKGGLHPEDPMFDFDFRGGKLKVKYKPYRQPAEVIQE